MREELEKHCGYFRGAGFKVALVPHSATCPVRLEVGANIVHDVCHNEVGKVAGGHTVRTVAKGLSGSGVDAEGSYDGVVHRCAIVGGGVHAVGSAGPLQEVLCCFGKAGVSAEHVLIVDAVERFLDYAGHVAHAAAYLHGVGCYYAAFLAFCRQFYYRGVFVGSLEGEVSEVYPCAAAHFLVDGELMRAVGGVYLVLCLVGAVGKALVADVHGIVAVFWYCRFPAEFF